MEGWHFPEVIYIIILAFRSFAKNRVSSKQKNKRQLPNPLVVLCLFRRRHLIGGRCFHDGRYDVGAMVTGWKWINGPCYYFDESGVMQSSKWIDGDYVDAEGKWIRGA